MKFFQFIFLILRRGTLFIKPVDFESKRRKVIDSISFPLPVEKPPSSPSSLWSIPGLYAIMAAVSYFRNRRDMNKMYYVSDSHRVVFVRILKAAGTSVLSEFLGLVDSKLKGSALSDEQVDALAYYFTKRNVPSSVESYESFAIVRDPYQRIVSVYLDLFDQSDPIFSYEAYWFGILKRDMSFKEFIKAITKIPTSLLGPHFAPQHVILKDTSHTKIFRLEKDANELTSFLGRYGMTWSHRNKQGTGYSYRSYYDKETFALVKSIYVGDVSQFDYKLEEDSLESSLAN